MMEIPLWWLVLSGAFFFLALLSFVAMIYLSLQVVGLIRELKPKIQRLTDRVDHMAEKIDSAVTSAKATVDTVGLSARNVAGSVSGAVSNSTDRVEKLAGVLLTAMAVLRLWKELQAVRSSGRKVSKKGDD